MSTKLASMRVRRLPACLAGGLGLAMQAHAAPPLITLTDCSDDDTVTALRNVVAALQPADNGALIDASACSTITLTQGAIDIPVSVTIQGAPAGTTIDANHGGSALRSTGNTANYNDLSLLSVSVTGGRNTAMYNVKGGCITVGGTLLLEGSSVTDCIAQSTQGGAYGGAIFAKSVTLHESHVSGSGAYTDAMAPASGGGIFSQGSLYCRGSTISGNHAASLGTASSGGGMAVFGAFTLRSCTVDSNASHSEAGIGHFGQNVGDNAIVSNSTISGNQAADAHGGLYTNQPLSIFNSTVANNSANYCGGIASTKPMVVYSTIVANNSSEIASCVDLKAPFGGISGSHNLVTVVNTAVPGDTIVADPLLVALADNGGSTRTHALAPGSPAIDHGASDEILTDQRGAGFDRVSGAATDIGAFEVQVVDLVFGDGFELPPP